MNLAKMFLISSLLDTSLKPRRGTKKNCREEATKKEQKAEEEEEGSLKRKKRRNKKK
ncbi:unnamed protein product [Brassica napus]|uniref:(rape) hypothetical protein n=1 Tax=Brassica napus TaxID=3708 RepID=A0A816YS79_BRANA|nr:unnamed protein product [Brassica napus]